MTADVSLAREEIVVTFKETIVWLLPKQVQMITMSAKMNLSHTPSETCNGLLSEFYEIQGIKFSVSEPIMLAAKKKSWKFIIF